MGSARIWQNGRIFTGERWADALLVEDGRVVAVGTSEEVRRAAATGADRVDLSGRLVVPGLIDAHLHLARITLARESLDVGGATSLPDLVERIRRWAPEHPSGTLVAHGWTAGQFGDADPTRVVMDDALPDRPLVIYHSSGHAAATNSAALRAAGIEPATPDPRGGRIGRDREGAPNGLVYESALRLLEPVTGEASEVGTEPLHRTLEIAASLGLTTVASMNVGPGESGPLASLRDAERLPLRVRMYLHREWFVAGAASGRAPLTDSERLSVVGFKGFTDGAFGPRTAWLSAPYADAPETSGLPLANDAELAEAVRYATELEVAPALHAIGDAAVGRSLEILEPAVGRAGPPARIEHVSLTPPPILSRLAEVRPALVVQPGFLWSDHWLRERLGPERARWAYAFRTLLDRGHLLAGSSDAPYDPIDPWRGLAAAVSRRGPLGRSANPSGAEALPPEEALQLYTRNGGRVLGEPDLGRLEVGARADLVLLESTELSGALAQGAAGVRETWVEGELVYRSSGIHGSND